MPTVTARRSRRRLHPWRSIIGHLISQMLLAMVVFVAALALWVALSDRPLPDGGQDALAWLVEVAVIVGCCAQAARRDPTIDQTWAMQLVVAGIVIVVAAWWAFTTWSGEPFDWSPGALLLDAVAIVIMAVSARVGVWWGQQLRGGDRRPAQGGR